MSLRITENDIKIFEYLYRFRVLNTRHISTLAGRKYNDAFRERLRNLFQEGYIDRPKNQRYIFTDRKGSYPLVYALSGGGANELKGKGFSINSEFWKDNNRRIKALSLEHSLYQSDYLVNLHRQCVNNGNARIIWKDEILKTASEETRGKNKPFSWETDFYFRGERAEYRIEPDDIFGIEYSNLLEKKSKKYFFLEIDSGAMPIVRDSVGQSSILRKFYSYADTHNRKLAKKYYGISNFRVLIVTSTDRRIKNMKACFKQFIEGKAPESLFLFEYRGMKNSTALEN